MTRKSGWCLDEVVAREDLALPGLAEQLHEDCRFPKTCTCPNHPRSEDGT